MTSTELSQWRESLERMLEQKGETLSIALGFIKDELKAKKAPFKLEQGSDGKWRILEVGDSTEAWLSRYITCDPDLMIMKEDVRKLSRIDEDSNQLFCVLICGDTGTGKEIIARALHGERTSKFIGVNCAGFPSELIESELFGHVGGAFTGASSKSKNGLMSEAGTLFLDEIGELPLQSQAKLLRAIQEKEIRKVGGVNNEAVSCRIICATNRKLNEMTDFRTDLYARISTFEIDTKPLSKRMDDVPLIIKSMDGGNEFLSAVEDYESEEKEYTYDLSLNVRSLQRAVKRYKVLGRLDV